jgi:hypothetical protein
MSRTKVRDLTRGTSSRLEPRFKAEHKPLFHLIKARSYHKSIVSHGWCGALQSARGRLIVGAKSDSGVHCTTFLVAFRESSVAELGAEGS